jgi:TolB protein
LPIRELQVVMNGAIISSVSNEQDKSTLQLKTRVQVPGSSWIAARVLSDAKLPYQTVYLDRADDIPVFAHTSPIYVDVPGSTRHSPADAEHFMEWIQQGMDWIQTQANVSTESERSEMLGLFERARKVYAAQTK